MTNPREIASLILATVYKGKTLDNALNDYRDLSLLEIRDRSFINLLVLTALRRHGEINNVILKFIKKPLKKNSRINFILRIAIAQLLFIDIPDYPVVDNAVEISKKYGFGGFVNAVLRNILRNKNSIIKNLKPENNIPDWIKNDLDNHFNKTSISSISKQIVKEPFVDIKIKKDVFKEFNWEKLLGGRLIFPETIRIKNKVEIKKLPFYDNGYWWVQGLAATLPVTVINDIFKKKDPRKISVLDVGSAPGGKLFQLLDLGYNVDSIEISSLRIKTLINNLERLKYKTRIMRMNFNNLNTLKKFDCILIDAPCSASGLMQKKPEILLSNKDISKLVNKQWQMLITATKHLKNRGFIIYCVCSIISKEGEVQMKNFLEKYKNFSLEIPFQSIKNFGYLNRKIPSILISPNFFKEDGGIDGFFIACLKKNY